MSRGRKTAEERVIEYFLDSPDALVVFNIVKGILTGRGFFGKPRKAAPKSRKATNIVGKIETIEEKENN